MQSCDGQEAGGYPVEREKFAEAKKEEDKKHGTIRPKTPHRLSTTTLGLDSKLILKEPSNE